ncbi:MAG: rod-binding protein [Verrucomicrobia bacterium]|nr:rod-binding protein [Verrucomicrobiota bacterium]
MISALPPTDAKPLENTATIDPALRLKRLKQATVDFESLLLQQMFQSMQSNLKGGGLAGEGLSGSIYSSIMTEAVAKSMAQNQSTGMADQLYQDFLRHYPDLKEVAEKEIAAAGHHASPAPEKGAPLAGENQGVEPVAHPWDCVPPWTLKSAIIPPSEAPRSAADANALARYLRAIKPPL